MKGSKKLSKLITVLVMLAVMVLGNVKNVYAAGASLDGPGSVRAGDTFTVNLVISDDGKYGYEGTLEYDSSQVTLTGVSNSLTGWEVETNGNKIVAYDDKLAYPLGGSAGVMQASFRVNSDVAAGTNINVSISGLVTTDGSNENSLGTASYSVTVAEPLSDNANLSGLTVSAGILSPAFNADTTTYDLGEVEYSVSSLTVNATKAHDGARVNVSGTSLSVGSNTVTVTVTAENGATKTYRIRVTRKQDPNYVASNNADLSSLSVSVGALSPAFDSAVTDYIVFLPFENKESAITLSGKTSDGKASVGDSSIESLKEGNNKLSIVCKAEDGTEKAYNVTVIVMPEYKGAAPKIEGVEPETETETQPETESETASEESSSEEETEALITPIEKTEKNDPPVLLMGVLVVLAAIMGFGGCYLLLSRDIIR